MKALLITSAAYVTNELAAEFGNIPPAFLPVGGQRLFHHQVKMLRARYDTMVLSLPSSFVPDAADQEALKSLGVKMVFTADGNSLRDSVLEVVREQPWSRLDILYGDTLLEIPDNLAGHGNWLLLGQTDTNYLWHDSEQSDKHRKLVWCGMFSFDEPERLQRTLEASKGFDDAVNAYGVAAELNQVICPSWLDFGHIHTFYISKRILTTERHFNHLKITRNMVIKSSADHAKMAAEAAWFENLPGRIRPYVPNYCGKDTSPLGQVTGYSTEYLGQPTLSELFTFGRLPPYAWAPILESIDAFLVNCAADQPPPQAPQEAIEQLYRKKTEARLEQYCRARHFDATRERKLNGQRTPSVERVLDEAASHVLGHPAHTAPLVHGDLCFSNVLYDFRTSRIKVIDPRGAQAHTGQMDGDLRYDVAKLAHSALGYYDLILAQRYRLRQDEDAWELHFHASQQEAVSQLFASTHFLDKSLLDWDSQPIMILLFLSMLPLHADRPDRQDAMLANALRLYKDWTR